MGWWSDLWVKRAEVWTFAPLSPSNVPDMLESQAIEPESRYVQLRLKSMYVRDVRRGLSKFYGTVHSVVSIPHRGGKDAEFNAVTTPNALKNVDAKNIERVVAVDFPLIGPVPYRGGELAVQVGLFSIKSENLADPFLNVLGTLSSISGVAFIATAQAFAKPLTEGINLLTGGADDTVLEIGLSTRMPVPKTGYYVVIRAPVNTFDVSTLKVSETDFALRESDGKPMRDYPYLVFAITASEERHDWFMIPELHKPYSELQAVVRTGKPKEVEDALITFERTAVTSDDLLFADGQRLAAMVRQQTESIIPIAIKRARAAKTPTAIDPTKRELKPLQQIALFQ